MLYNFLLFCFPVPSIFTWFPRVYVESEPLLIARAMNKQTALVIISGEDVTTAAAIVNGEIVTGSVSVSDVAGQAVTWYLSILTQVSFGDLDDIVYDENKIEYCYVALDYEEELKKNPDNLRVTLNHEGRPLNVDVDQERFMAPEVLFKTKPYSGSGAGAVQDLANSAWEAAPTIAQDELLENVVLAGGNTLIAGFPERLQKELSHITGRDVTIHAPSNRRFLTWLGGKLLAQTLWNSV